MTFFISFLVQTIAMLWIIISIHEFAHYLIARLVKRKIYEISLGIGPTLFRIGILAIKCIPLGGYNRLEISFVCDNPSRKSLLEDLFIILAGNIATLILAIISLPLSKFFSFYALAFSIGNLIPISNQDGQYAILILKKINKRF